MSASVRRVRALTPPTCPSMPQADGSSILMQRSPRVWRSGFRLPVQTLISTSFSYWALARGCHLQTRRLVLKLPSLRISTPTDSVFCRPVRPQTIRIRCAQRGSQLHSLPRLLMLPRRGRLISQPAIKTRRAWLARWESMAPRRSARLRMDWTIRRLRSQSCNRSCGMCSAAVRCRCSTTSGRFRPAIPRRRLGGC